MPCAKPSRQWKSHTDDLDVTTSLIFPTISSPFPPTYITPDTACGLHGVSSLKKGISSFSCGSSFGTEKSMFQLEKYLLFLFLPLLLLLLLLLFFFFFSSSFPPSSFLLFFPPFPPPERSLSHHKRFTLFPNSLFVWFSIWPLHKALHAGKIDISAGKGHSGRHQFYDFVC